MALNREPGGSDDDAQAAHAAQPVDVLHSPAGRASSPDFH